MKKAVFLLFALLVASAAFGQEKQKVAVYITGEADAGYKEVIGAKMVAAVTKDDNYAAVERTADFLAELKKEHKYQQMGDVNDQQIVELGKQFGADFVCVANVSKVFESIFIAARMINVTTGLIAATADRDKEVKGMSDLVEISENVAGELFGEYKSLSNNDAEDWNHQAKDYKDKSEYAQAFDLLKKSAESGNARGMCNLGYLYEMGLGTPKDNAKAVHYYKLSAKEKFKTAQYNLGLMYEYGVGVKQDMNEARNLYKEAADQGLSEAKKKLNELKN
jgi:TPR repeat protein